MIVIDASAFIDAFAGNEAVLRRIAGEDLHAPHLLDVEVASALRRLALAGEIEVRDAEAVLATLTEVNLTRHSHVPLLGPIWALRRSIGAYDAVYVALAAALRAPLLTTDRKLAAASDLLIVVEVP